MADQMLEAPTLADVQAAAVALKGIVNRTPVLENADVNTRLGGRLLLKVEGAQRTGAFKFRGAYNRIRQMDAAQKARGVISYSSGNHAQGVALAAKLLGSHALIVMPDDVPVAKMQATRALGAKVVTYQRAVEDSAEVVARLQATSGRIHVPPSEDGRVMAGGGTAALELHQQAGALDAVLVPCGGGGLTAATAIVMAELSPATQVFAVEPELLDDTKRSLAAGKRLSNPKGCKTICDAIMTPTPNALTFSINKGLLVGALTVSDDQVRSAMLFAYEHFKIVVEPGAAVGLAAVLNDKIDIKGKVIATILTGGNVDWAAFCAALKAANSMKKE